MFVRTVYKQYSIVFLPQFFLIRVCTLLNNTVSIYYWSYIPFISLYRILCYSLIRPVPYPLLYYSLIYPVLYTVSFITPWYSLYLILPPDIPCIPYSWVVSCMWRVYGSLCWYTLYTVSYITPWYTLYLILSRDTPCILYYPLIHPVSTLAG